MCAFIKIACISENRLFFASRVDRAIKSTLGQILITSVFVISSTYNETPVYWSLLFLNLKIVVGLRPMPCHTHDFVACLLFGLYYKTYLIVLVNVNFKVLILIFFEYGICVISTV